MTTLNNDTLMAGQQHDAAQRHTPKEKKSLFKDSMIAKVLGSATAGMAVGVGASYASARFNHNDDMEARLAELEEKERARQQQEQQQQEQQQQQEEERRQTEQEEQERIRQEQEQQQQEQQQEQQRQQEEERQQAEQEEQERIRQEQEQQRQQLEQQQQEQQQEQQRQQEEEERRQAEQEEQERIRQEQEQQRQQQEQQRQRNEQEEQQQPGNVREASFMKDHEVKIESVSEVELEDGRTVQVFHGTVDGYPANFLTDGNGQVVAAAVDQNGNGEVDDNEVINLRDEHITVRNLVACQVTPDEPEITVVEVRNDVETEHGTVDMAIVTVNDQNMVLVDTDQDREVNLVITDNNHNNQVDEGEIKDVSESHITMPTQDDINGNLMAQTDEDGQDYSNDADTTLYDA